MGGTSSSEEIFDRTPLTPQQKFVGTMSTRYVRTKETTLLLEDQFWSKHRTADIDIVETSNDNKVVFRVPASKEGDLPTKQALLDAYGVQIVRTESRNINARGAGYSVYPGGTTATTRFIDFKTEMTPFEKMLRMDFVDRITGVQVKVGVTGQWLHRVAMVWVESGQWQARLAIARIHKPIDTPEGKFCVDIAAGVDLQLIVLIIGALDEQHAKHKPDAEKRAKDAAKDKKKSSKSKSSAAKTTTATAASA